MNGISLAAMLLAAAVVTAPAPPNRRLPVCVDRPATRSGALVGALAVGGLAASAASVAPTLVAVSLVATGVLALRLRRLRRTQRRRREAAAIAAALDVLVGELKVGAHPAAAFAVAGAEASGLVGRSLRAVSTRAQLGADVAEGIRAVALSSAVPAHWDRLAVFWQLAAEHGLGISVLMRAAHRDIVDRQRFADRMHAALAGARATAMILASLPVLGLVLGQLLGADPVAFLLGGGSGGALLMVGVSLIGIGVLWADRIIDRLAA